MKVKRFSYYRDLGERADQGISDGIEFADSVSAKLLEDKRIGKTRGVQRWGRLVNNTTKLIRKRRKKDELDNGK